MLIGKQIVMELPADEDSLNRIGVNSNEKLTDSVGHEPNDDEDHHSIRSILICWNGWNEQVGNEDVDDHQSHRNKFI